MAQDMSIEAQHGGDESDEVSSGYARRVGERLRAIRKQKDLSLQDVEDTSAQEFKASVLGAYERGERAISVPRLQRLARFYGVPVDQLLPGDAMDLDSGPRLPGDVPLRIDLQALSALEPGERDLLFRFLHTIQMERQDYNGRILTIRRDDERAIACLLDTSPGTLRQRLDGMGVLVNT